MSQFLVSICNWGPLGAFEFEPFLLEACASRLLRETSAVARWDLSELRTSPTGPTDREQRARCLPLHPSARACRLLGCGQLVSYHFIYFIYFDYKAFVHYSDLFFRRG